MSCEPVGLIGKIEQGETLLSMKGRAHCMFCTAASLKHAAVHLEKLYESLAMHGRLRVSSV